MPVIIQGEEAAEAANPRCHPGDGAHKLGAGVDVHAGAQAGARAKGHGRPPYPRKNLPESTRKSPPVQNFR